MLLLLAAALAADWRSPEGFGRAAAALRFKPAAGKAGKAPTLASKSGVQIMCYENMICQLETFRLTSTSSPWNICFERRSFQRNIW